MRQVGMGSPMTGMNALLGTCRFDLREQMILGPIDRYTHTHTTHITHITHKVGCGEQQYRDRSNTKLERSKHAAALRVRVTQARFFCHRLRATQNSAPTKPKKAKRPTQASQTVDWLPVLLRSIGDCYCDCPACI